MKKVKVHGSPKEKERAHVAFRNFSLLTFNFQLHYVDWI